MVITLQVQKEELLAKTAESGVVLEMLEEFNARELRNSYARLSVLEWPKPLSAECW